MKEVKKRGRPVGYKKPVEEKQCQSCEQEKAIDKLKKDFRLLEESFNNYKLIHDQELKKFDGKVNHYGSKTKEVIDCLEALRNTAQNDRSYVDSIREWLTKKGIL